MMAQVATDTELKKTTGPNHRSTQSGSNLSTISSTSAGENDEFYESVGNGMDWANDQSFESGVVHDGD